MKNSQLEKLTKDIVDELIKNLERGIGPDLWERIAPCKTIMHEKWTEIILKKLMTIKI